MNSNYNYSDFVGMNLSSNNQFDYYSSQAELRLQPVSELQQSPGEKRIENMLLDHSKYYVYCE